MWKIFEGTYECIIIIICRKTWKRERFRNGIYMYIYIFLVIFKNYCLFCENCGEAERKFQNNIGETVGMWRNFSIISKK